MSSGANGQMMLMIMMMMMLMVMMMLMMVMMMVMTEKEGFVRGHVETNPEHCHL